MGDSPQSETSSAKKLTNALAAFAPKAIQALTGQTGDTANSLLAAEQQVAPGYRELYGQDALAASQAEAAVAGGPGAELVGLADKYQRQLDPEYYAQRSVINEALNKYLGGYNPYELSETETAQLARGINATEGPGVPSNMKTIKNAQVFGDAGTKRWQNFGNAITQASTAIPALKSGISGFGTATSRGNITGAREAAQGAMNTNFGFGNNYLSQIGAAQQAKIAKQKDTMDMVVGGTQAFGNIMSGIGSMI